MKLFGFHNEGNFWSVGWRKNTLVCFGVPLISREACVLTFNRGGGQIMDWIQSIISIKLAK